MFMNTTADASRQARPADPGDLGRRVALRRAQLGLSRAETAERAGMDPGYVEYLETSPANAEIGSVLRLAAALETSATQLLGGGLGLPPGRAGAAAGARLDELAAWECWAKLAPGGIGRIALATSQGPTVLPVNYRVLDGTLVFRTAADGPLAAAVAGRVAVEVDQVDEATRTGWSVLVTGDASRLDDPDALQQLRRRRNPEPWAGGARELWVRVKPTDVTGRTIRSM